MTVNIVVVGAGVSGLTTALLLSKHKDYAVTIVAKHVPGDSDIEYASPWAGANFLPFSKPNTPAQKYERDTWPELERLARDVPEAGIHFQNTILYRRAKDSGTPTGDWMADLVSQDPWFKNLVPNFRILDQSALPPGIDGGTSFTSVCMNVGLYLPWLTSQCLRNGAKLRQTTVTHISDAASLHHSGRKADIVINCTGLSSLRLGGVQDSNLYPARGQIVIVRNDAGGNMYTVSGTDDDPAEAMYIMQRPGGGTVLGGCLQAGNWESQPDPNLATRIMKRCVEYCPGLVKEGQGIEGLSVVRHGVGLRPMRTGGIRVERDIVEGIAVVHNYGHGGYGYQTSYGCGATVERLVEEALRERARL